MKLALILIFLAIVAATLLAVFIRLKRKWEKGTRSVEAEALKKRVRARPLRVESSTDDRRLAYVAVWPTSGDVVPESVIAALDAYVNTLSAKEIGRRLRLEYREGTWRQAEAAADAVPPSP